MGVHPRSWATDPEHLPVWDDEPARGCAALVLCLLLVLALGLLLGLVWLAVV